MSAEEVDEDDLLGDEEKFERDMALQRWEDAKNGHFQEENDFFPSLPNHIVQSCCSSEKEGGGRLQSLEETQVMKDVVCCSLGEAAHHPLSHFLEENKSSPSLPNRSVLPCSPSEKEDGDHLHSLEEIQAMKDACCSKLGEVAHQSLSHILHKKNGQSTASSNMQPVLLQPAGLPAEVLHRGAVYQANLTVLIPDNLIANSDHDKAAQPSNQNAITSITSHMPIKYKKKGRKRNGGGKAGKAFVLHSLLHGKSHAHTVDALNEAITFEDASKKLQPPHSTSAALLAGMEEFLNLGDQSSHASKAHSTKNYLLSGNTEDHDILAHLHPQPLTQQPPKVTHQADPAACLDSILLGQVNDPPSTFFAEPNHISPAHPSPIPEPKHSQPNIHEEPKKSPIAEATATVSLLLPPASSSLTKITPSPPQAPSPSKPQPQSSSAHSSLHKFTHPIQKKYNSKLGRTKPNHHSQALAAALFSGKSQLPNLVEENLHHVKSKNGVMIDEDMTDFPPLQPPAHLESREQSNCSRDSTRQSAGAEQHIRETARFLPPSISLQSHFWGKTE